MRTEIFWRNRYEREDDEISNLVKFFVRSKGRERKKKEKKKSERERDGLY